MFHTLATRYPADPDYPDRVHALAMMQRVLDGTLYDVLPNAFHDEKTPSGDYVPLRERRPSVRYNICREVVERSVGMLFGEGRFPELVCEDKATADALETLVREAAWQPRLSEAAFRGSIGSVALILRVLRGRVFVECMPGTYLTPEYDPEAPDVLLRLTEARKVTGRALRQQGYDIGKGDDGTMFWFRREWGLEKETWYLPQRVGDAREGRPPVVDAARTVPHPLGFVPAVWIENLPGGESPDGLCTFRPAIETQIEIEYLLSQGGRALKYASDPLLMIREPAGADNELVRSAGNALVVSEKGDAKLLEIGGTATSALLEMVRALREWTLEVIHGDRSSADKLTAAQSGKALELLNAPLISLADRLRGSYGQHGLLELARMVARASHIVPLRISGVETRDLSPEISLRWHGWFSQTEGDKLQQAQALTTLTAGKLVSRETATGAVADVLDIEDVQAELSRIDKEAAADDARDVAKQTALTANKPATPGKQED